MRNLWLLILIIDILASSSVVINHKLVASTVYFGDHLVLLGGLGRRMVAAVATDGTRRLVCHLVLVHVVSSFFVGGG